VRWDSVESFRPTPGAAAWRDAVNGFYTEPIAAEYYAPVVGLRP
jgi:hypothetical protein